jgi:hypothetical protein
LLLPQVVACGEGKQVMYCCCLHMQVCQAIRAAGMYCGIALKPATAPELVFPYIDAGMVDMVGEVPTAPLLMQTMKGGCNSMGGIPTSNNTTNFTTRAVLPQAPKAHRNHTGRPDKLSSLVPAWPMLAYWLTVLPCTSSGASADCGAWVWWAEVHGRQDREGQDPEGQVCVPQH